MHRRERHAAASNQANRARKQAPQTSDLRSVDPRSGCCFVVGSAADSICLVYVQACPINQPQKEGACSQVGISVARGWFGLRTFWKTTRHKTSAV